MAVSAYVLIQTEVGKAAQVAEEVSGIEGVVSAEDVTGPYDVIVRAEANSVDELGKMVVSRVQLEDHGEGALAERLADAAWTATRALRHERVVDTDFPVEDKFDFLKTPSRQKMRARGVAAFVTVQEGCDKFCTFCVVPYTRGAEVSRPVEKIAAEVTRLADAGVREVTLIGQNVNAYHGEGADGRAWTLGRLLHRIAEIPGIARIRYTTSHPRDVDDSLVAAHRDLPCLMPYLHLPLQSGSDRILAAMNRRHTRDEYMAVIARMRAARHDLALSSDFIVGFPGETEDDFRASLEVVDMVGYAGAFSFKYSPRPGTPAAGMEQVPEEVKSERLQRLQKAIDRSQAAFNTICHGRTGSVIKSSMVPLRRSSAHSRMAMAGISTRNSHGCQKKKPDRSACPRSKKPETRNVMPAASARKTMRKTAVTGVAK